MTENLDFIGVVCCAFVCSEACLPSSMCDWFWGSASAANWQPSHCIRKPIGLHSGVPTQLKSSAGRWKRGQHHFITAVVRRLASDCCRHWLYWSKSVFGSLNHPDAAGRGRRMRQISSISTLRLLKSSKHPVLKHDWIGGTRLFTGVINDPRRGICHDFFPPWSLIFFFSGRSAL